MTNWTIRKTSRGFDVVDIKDANRQSGSLQASSAIMYEDAPPGTSAVWLGVDDSRLHLNREMVDELIDLLSNWKKTGRLMRFND